MPPSQVKRTINFIWLYSLLIILLKVVEAIIEHDPEHQLSKIINKLFGEERPKLTENDKKERQALKATNPAPNMARLLVEIGQDIVQEATYYDIVYARNLPETPKNMDAYKQARSKQLKAGSL